MVVLHKFLFGFPHYNVLDSESSNISLVILDTLQYNYRNLFFRKIRKKRGETDRQPEEQHLLIESPRQRLKIHLHVSLTPIGQNPLQKSSDHTP